MMNKRIKYYKIDGVGVRFKRSEIEERIEASAVEAVDYHEKARELLRK